MTDVRAGAPAPAEEPVRTAHRYVVIEGPIGVGKTSLARRLARSFGSELVLEQDDENPFLERFYRNPRAAAFQTQLFFLFQRARQLQDLRQADLFETVRVADYLLDKDRLFARLTLDERGVHALRTGLRAARDRRAGAGPRRLPAGACRRAARAHRAPRHRIRAAHRAALPRARRRGVRAVLPRVRRRPGPDRERGRDRSGRRRRGLRRACSTRSCRRAAAGTTSIRSRTCCRAAGRPALMFDDGCFILAASRKASHVHPTATARFDPPAGQRGHARSHERAGREDRRDHLLRRELRGAGRCVRAPTSCWSATRSAW